MVSCAQFPSVPQLSLVVFRLVVLYEYSRALFWAISVPSVSEGNGSRFHVKKTGSYHDFKAWNCCISQSSASSSSYKNGLRFFDKTDIVRTWHISGIITSNPPKFFGNLQIFLTVASLSNRNAWILVFSIFIKYQRLCAFGGCHKYTDCHSCLQLCSERFES